MTADRPIVILGAIGHVGPPMLAEHLLRRGHRPVFLQPTGSDRTLDNGVAVFSATARMTDARRKAIARRRDRIAALERRLVFPLARRRIERFLDEFARSTEQAAMAPVIERNLLIAEVVDSLQPALVFGNHVIEHGLATAAVRSAPTILMPWGGDIYNIAEATPLAMWMAKRALRGADLVLPSAATAIPHLEQRFGVPANRIRAISWGVDLSMFQPAADEERQRIRGRYDLPLDAPVIFNTRRFKHAWGAEVVIDATLRVLETHPDAVVVCIAGGGNDPEMHEARLRVEAAGAGDAFRFFDGTVPLETFADLARVTDVGLSLKLTDDMRSISVLQPAYAGAAMILSDQPEYRDMERGGLRARFVDPQDIDAVTAAIRDALDSGTTPDDLAATRAFIEDDEDNLVQMDRIVDVIESMLRD